MPVRFIPKLFLSLLMLSAAHLPANAEEPPTPVLAVEATTASIDLQRTLVGRVAARRTVDIAFEVPGRLIRLHAGEGERLSIGAPLAELETGALDLVLDEARIAAEQAAASYLRVQTLHARGVVAEAALEEARAAHELHRIAVQEAERDLELAALSAPFEAMVAQRLVPENSLIEAGTAVLRLHDVSEWQVIVSVPEALMRLGSSLEDVRIEAVTGSDRARRIPLEYREHRAEPDPVAQTFMVTFVANLPPDAGLLPGMAVTVEIDASGADAASDVAVPASALLPAEDGSLLVWRIRAGRADPVAVVVAGIAGERVLVTAGLAAGELVVTAGQGGLRPGQPVRPLTER